VDNDSELLRRYAEEASEDAFRELVRLRVSLVYGSAYRQLGNRQRAEEVVQAVFTDLAQKASALSRRAVLASWLYTSTHYAVANLVRKERRQRIREHEAYLMHDIDSEGGSRPEWDQMRPVLDEELNGLDARDRDAVLLRFFESKSFAEIGDALRLSEDAARKRVDRALERLRLRLGIRGITSTSAVLSAILAEQAAIAAPAELAGFVAKAALLQAVGTATTTAGILSFMSTSKIALGAGALLVVLSLGSALFEGWQSWAAGAELAALQGQSAAAALQLSALTAKVAAAEQAVAALGARAQVTKSAPTADGAAPGSAAPGNISKAKGDEFMARHPEVRDALIADIDARNHAQYAALYSQLGLSADQIRQMEVLLRQRSGDFGRMLQNGMVTFSIRPDIVDDQSAGLTALLGETGFQQFEAYSQTLVARTEASNLASLLVTTDSPLSATQALQLVPIFVNAGDRTTGQFDWTSVYAAAQGVLSAPQLEMLRNLGTGAQGWHQVLAASH
jgi:RNA polymerase sigma factor (sigma-70 family)